MSSMAKALNMVENSVEEQCQELSRQVSLFLMKFACRELAWESQEKINNEGSRLILSDGVCLIEVRIAETDTSFICKTLVFLYLCHEIEVAYYSVTCLSEHCCRHTRRFGSHVIVSRL